MSARDRDYMRKPEGVMSYVKWVARHPEPTVAQLVNRYMEVDAAILRCKGAGVQPKDEWLDELLGRLQLSNWTAVQKNHWGPWT